MQEPRRVPSSEDDGMRSNLFFPATCASEKTLLRPQTCELETQTKPSEAGLFGRGGARERSDAWPSGRDERCGLCPDDVRCSGLHLFEKMLAFLRETVDVVVSLNAPGHSSRGVSASGGGMGETTGKSCSPPLAFGRYADIIMSAE